jgi:hypothetical protein
MRAERLPANLGVVCPMREARGRHAHKLDESVRVALLPAVRRSFLVAHIRSGLECRHRHFDAIAGDYRIAPALRDLTQLPRPVARLRKCQLGNGAKSNVAAPSSHLYAQHP